VLGLADDELYQELLRLVVERKPEAVFPLVERLCEAGVDLSEFMAGAAEVLRGLLMLQVGAEPDDVTEGLRAMLEGYRERLQPGDILRMLRLLADDENNIRRTVNPRLAVETLLLRWSLLDRVVNLEEVLEAGRRGSGEAGKEVAGKQGSREAGKVVPESARAESPLTAPEASPRPRVPASPLLGPASPPIATLAPSIEAIRAGWPAILVAARVQSRFLGELLSAVEPVELALPYLNVVMRESNELFAEGLEREAAKVEEILTRSLGQPVRLKLTAASAAPAQQAGKSRRISDSSIKADRLREFRSKDPTLDTAADALDLEIVD
jgi:DNA polymerase III gamma/tau subunit